MLGLVQEVGCEQPHIGAPVGDHETLRRAEDHERDAAVALHLDLRGLHGRAARAEHLEHLRDRLRAERERGDAGGAVRAEDVPQPELVRDHEHRRIDQARRPRERRHDDGDLGHPGDDGGRPDLDEHRRERALAARDVQADARDRRRALAELEAGLELDAPVRPLEHALVVAADVGDALADRPHDLLGNLLPRALDLVLRDAQRVDGDLAAVELAQRADDRLVAVLAHVLDDPKHSLAQPGVEDAARLTCEQDVAGVRVERGPVPHPEWSLRHFGLRRW